MNHRASMHGRCLSQDEIAFMARELVLVTLPHKDPGEVPDKAKWQRDAAHAAWL
jgi:hypothetical protein